MDGVITYWSATLHAPLIKTVWESLLKENEWKIPDSRVKTRYTMAAVVLICAQSPLCVKVTSCLETTVMLMMSVCRSSVTPNATSVSLMIGTTCLTKDVRFLKI